MKVRFGKTGREYESERDDTLFGNFAQKRRGTGKRKVCMPDLRGNGSVLQRQTKQTSSGTMRKMQNEND